MARTCEQLRRDALAIWNAGLEAVRSERLVRKAVRVEGDWLHVADQSLLLGSIGRIEVVGAGKAGAGMADAVLAALGPEVCAKMQVDGWINVPADCVRPLPRIHLHAARPAGVNEPTSAGLAGAQEILRRVAKLAPRDLCIALVSGGGSALLPAPIEGVSLDDKLAVTRLLSGAGAPIEDLNRVRQALSRIKGGGLARACRAGRLITLIISDVLGDPLDLIASGPTVTAPVDAQRASDILNHYGAREAGIAPAVFDALARRNADSRESTAHVSNHVIGNNRAAVDAAARHARSLGYAVTSTSAARSEAAAEDVGRDLVEQAQALAQDNRPVCLVSGGEPTVRLVEPSRRGRGGRNQQLALAALLHLEQTSRRRMLVLSGGTDGEDGPTDAAGAWVDDLVRDTASRLALDAREHLERNDAYPFFEACEALLKTGPTDTNVCDLRVVLVDR